MTPAGIAVVAFFAFAGFIFLFSPRAFYRISRKVSRNNSPEPTRVGLRVVRICGAVIAAMCIASVFLAPHLR
ncbi:DUF6199 family natural product biosynthesis protein [Streptomyces parvus]|uniref:DUF6199 family natural product biosynthesis protein n=1 Tax=Streptomyces parvus TaxID=66428 RepID=UPI0037FF0BAE